MCEVGGVGFEEAPSKMPGSFLATHLGAASRGVASESDQDSVPGRAPLKEERHGLGLGKEPCPHEEEKKVSLGPVSYVPTIQKTPGRSQRLQRKGQGPAGCTGPEGLPWGPSAP